MTENLDYELEEGMLVNVEGRRYGLRNRGAA